MPVWVWFRLASWSCRSGTLFYLLLLGRPRLFLGTALSMLVCQFWYSSGERSFTFFLRSSCNASRWLFISSIASCNCCNFSNSFGLEFFPFARMISAFSRYESPCASNRLSTLRYFPFSPLRLASDSSFASCPQVLPFACKKSQYLFFRCNKIFSALGTFSQNQIFSVYYVI